MAVKVFVDFDGTITRGDVGDALYRAFGGPVCDLLIGQYHAGELGARECFRGEAAAMGYVRAEALDAFIASREIDRTFHGMVDFCRARGLELRIVSDGLDYYLQRILQRYGLADVPFVANTVSLHDRREDGAARVCIGFPHPDAECDRCACCKRNIMLTLCGEEDIICYVGEGFSDMCPVRYADIVFAKDALQAYCQRENISYYPYASFDDVTARLRGLLERPRLHRRRRAEEARRAAFVRES